MSPADYKATREKLGLTQAGLAARLGLDIVLGNGPGRRRVRHADREPLTSCLNAWSQAEEASATQPHPA